MLGACRTFSVVHVRVHALRPFLTQSIFRQLKTALFDWTFFGLDSSNPSYRQSSRFYSFVLFLEAVGVRKYCCTTVWQSKIGWQLCASRVPRGQRVLRARQTLVQAGWWRWTSAESRQSYVCGVALSLELPKLQQS